MPRLLAHALSLLAGLLAAVALAACGSDGDRSGLIPAGDAETLESRLDAVSSALEEGDCGGIGEDVSRLRGALVQLPDSLDPRLREELDRGVDNIAERAPQECEEPTETTETVETVPTETETAPTETETTPPTTTTAIPTTTTPVPVEPAPVEPGGVEPPTVDPTLPDDDTGGFAPEEVVP